MGPVLLLCVGSLKSAWAKDAAQQYLLRLGPCVTVRELPASKQHDPKKQMEDESERLVDVIADQKGRTFVLDERGKAMTSVVFAAEIERAKDRGERLTFVLGGAYGLNDAVRKSGSMIKLSDMTLPHELCRVVFLEQLYRAAEIGKGSGYHHGAAPPAS